MADRPCPDCGETDLTKVGVSRDYPGHTCSHVLSGALPATPGPSRLEDKVTHTAHDAEKFELMTTDWEPDEAYWGGP